MAEKSDIEWCDATINLWWGCTKVSPGCANCYADTLAKRWGKDVWGKGKAREDHRANAIKTAKKLDRTAAKEGKRLRVFSASMSDWLDDEVPIEWLADLLALIHATPNLDWLLLTKRPENFRARLCLVIAHAGGDESENGVTNATYGFVRNWITGDGIPPNVWVGTTVEDQTRADQRIPKLLEIPARVRFLSAEPLLGPLNLSETKADGEQYSWLQQAFHDPKSPTKMRLDPPRIHWVICGGESGPGARPFDITWARSLRNQCEAAGVAFFMKQLGSNPVDNAFTVLKTDKKGGDFDSLPQDLRIRQFPTP